MRDCLFHQSAVYGNKIDKNISNSNRSNGHVFNIRLHLRDIFLENLLNKLSNKIYSARGFMNNNVFPLNEQIKKKTILLL